MYSPIKSVPTLFAPTRTVLAKRATTLLRRYALTPSSHPLKQWHISIDCSPSFSYQWIPCARAYVFHGSERDALRWTVILLENRLAEKEAQTQRAVTTVDLAHCPRVRQYVIDMENGTGGEETEATARRPMYGLDVLLAIRQHLKIDRDNSTSQSCRSGYTECECPVLHTAMRIDYPPARQTVDHIYGIRAWKRG